MTRDSARDMIIGACALFLEDRDVGSSDFPGPSLSAGSKGAQLTVLPQGRLPRSVQ